MRADVRIQTRAHRHPQRRVSGAARVRVADCVRTELRVERACRCACSCARAHEHQHTDVGTRIRAQMRVRADVCAESQNH